MTYAHPDSLVDTEWVQSNMSRSDVCLVEVDVDTTLYEQGHIPGAVGWSWKTQLCDTVRRDILSAEAMSDLLSRSGIRPESTIILYGDNHNWFAAWAFWQLKIYGHEDVRMMDGGRAKWEADGRAMDTDVVQSEPSGYRVTETHSELRALLPRVQEEASNGTTLIDVRSPEEFSGEVLAPPGLPETCQRGGHIPGATNVPWSMAVNADGTFRSRDELDRLYDDAGATHDRPVITYCRIGERSSHTWFVLTHLLGHENVRNYDGSWTEWGNLVGAEVGVGA